MIESSLAGKAAPLLFVWQEPPAVPPGLRRGSVACCSWACFTHSNWGGLPALSRWLVPGVSCSYWDKKQHTAQRESEVEGLKLEVQAGMLLTYATYLLESGIAATQRLKGHEIHQLRKQGALAGVRL